MATTLTITSLDMLRGLIKLMQEDNGVRIEKNGQPVEVEKLHYGDRITLFDTESSDHVVSRLANKRSTV